MCHGVAGFECRDNALGAREELETFEAFRVRRIGEL